MSEYGRPTAEPVAEEAARAAWLTARHADRRLDVQRRALHLMQQTVSAGKAVPGEPAFLHDRTLVNEGRNQRYGTQIAGVKDRAPIPWPCEEPERMDTLRTQVGIKPFDEYAATSALA